MLLACQEVFGRQSDDFLTQYNSVRKSFSSDWQFHILRCLYPCLLSYCYDVKHTTQQEQISQRDSISFLLALESKAISGYRQKKCSQPVIQNKQTAKVDLQLVAKLVLCVADVRGKMLFNRSRDFIAKEEGSVL